MALQAQGRISASMTVHRALRPMNTSFCANEYGEGEDLLRAAHSDKYVLCQEDCVVWLRVLDS